MRKQAIAFLTIITALAIYQLQRDAFVDQVQEQDVQLQIKSLDINFGDLFNDWKKIHHKSYASDQEERYRLKIFVSNCRKIYSHNRNKDSLGYTHSFGLNQFSDLTKEEYISLLTTYSSRDQFKQKNKLSQQLNITLQCTGAITLSPNPPDQVDWSKKAVTPVMNQGKCGSSYAFTAVGAVQGLYSLKVQKIQQFSVQQILECSGSYGNQGCFGGFMDQTFWYIIDNGLATSKIYPLKNSTDTSKCTYTKVMKATSFTRCAEVPSGNYAKLQSAVIQQPTAVAIDASELQYYQSGIYNGKCSNSYINQAMLVVGYGSQDNQTYWKIKNSVGTKWGQSGYLLLERQEEDGPGKCGIHLVASVPQNLV